MVKYRKKPKPLMGLFLAGLVFCLAGGAWAAPRAAKGKENALLEAAKRGEVAEVNRLLAQGVKVNAKDQEGFTALMRAAEEGHLSVVQALLEKGAEVNAKNHSSLRLPWLKEKFDPILKGLMVRSSIKVALDSDGWTALMMAAEKGHLPVVQVLLEKGANVNDKDNRGKTALMVAAREGHQEVVQALLGKGAEVNAKTTYCPPLNILQEAAKLRLHPLIQEFLKEAIIGEAKEKDGWTALMWAAEGGHQPVVQTLLEKGAEVNARDKDGKTALMWAAEGGHQPVVQTLLEKGAEVNTRDKDGRTALMGAAAEGHLSVVQMLLEKGAEVNAKDNKGKTAWDYAEDRKVKELLKKPGGSR